MLYMEFKTLQTKKLLVSWGGGTCANTFDIICLLLKIKAPLDLLCCLCGGAFEPKIKNLIGMFSQLIVLLLLFKALSHF